MAEPTTLSERNATVVLADRPVMDRVAQAVSTATGLSYLEALDGYQNRLEALGPEATVGAVLGKDAAEVLQMVRLLEGNAEQIHRTLDAAMPEMPEGERVRRLPSTSGRVFEQVLLPSDADHGRLLANPEEAERRLARARAHDPGGVFAGDDGRKQFAAEDKEAVEQGWDLPRSLERDDEVRAAKRLAKNEAGRLARPMEAAQAARGEQRRLEQRARSLDRRIEANEAERRERRRRGVSAADLTPLGVLLEHRRETTTSLEQATLQVRRLESLPAATVERPSPTGSVPPIAAGTTTIEATRKMQLEIDTASAYCQSHPETNFVEALTLAQEGAISMNPRALADKRVRKFMLANNIPPAEYDKTVRELLDAHVVLSELP